MMIITSFWELLYLQAIPWPLIQDVSVANEDLSMTCW